jgi:oligopeptide/dipeptide ABC transporter ATP-binding protein
MPGLVEAHGLHKAFPVRGGVLRGVRGYIRAVDGVSLSIAAGETLGVVGESGCGKTTLGRLLVGLLRPDQGSIVLEGKPLQAWRDRRALYQQIQMIFQDPLAALDPRFTIAQSVAEPLRALGCCPRREVLGRVKQILREVQLPDTVFYAYPHELSGGMLQRVVIARAMVVRPRFVVCDEPVSSLDLSIQGQILQLLQELQQKYRTAYLFISHDLAVVHKMSRRIAVMYLGRVVESGPADRIIRQPRHPYTEALLAAVPRITPEGMVLPIRPLAGEPPSPKALPSGCRFRTRCPLATPDCAAQDPPVTEQPPGHGAACLYR